MKFDNNYSDLPLFRNHLINLAKTNVSEKISASDLGLTLVHEHIFNKFPINRQEESLSFTKKELEKLQKYGVETIIDLTPYTNLNIYEEIINSSPVQIICCIGFYLPKYIKASDKSLSQELLITQLSKKIEKGIGKLKIKPGILKIAGNHNILTSLEEKIYSVIGSLQNKYSLPIASHSPKGSYEQFNVLVKNGANPKKIFFAHLDQGFLGKKFNLVDRQREIDFLLKQGSFIQFSEFGNTTEFKTQRLLIMKKILLDICNKGFINQILISSDSNWRWKRGKICLKNSYKRGIPNSFEYTFKIIIPYLRSIGFKENQIDEILIENPRLLFS